MTSFRFDNTLTTAERDVLVYFYGEVAVRNHAVFLANYNRIHSIFPLHQRSDAELLKLAERPE